MRVAVTLLGCGNSGGVPEIGCTCSICTSSDPKNKRSRVSAFVQVDELNLLIDTSPDLRQQALQHSITRIDAVLYTHDHADHANGIDDLRSFNKLSGTSLGIYGSCECLEVLQHRFSYAFMPKKENLWYRPSLTPHPLEMLEGACEFTIQDSVITAFEQIHGKTTTLGYRIGDFAYSTDTNLLPESAFKVLEGVEIWVVDCLRYTESFSHSYLERTLEWAERVKPRLTILTHMAHEFDYNTLLDQLPAGVTPAYDGMVICCN